LIYKINNNIKESNKSKEKSEREREKDLSVGFGFLSILGFGYQKRPFLLLGSNCVTNRDPVKSVIPAIYQGHFRNIGSCLSKPGRFFSIFLFKKKRKIKKYTD
jgi:hypothetical protein